MFDLAARRNVNALVRFRARIGFDRLALAFALALATPILVVAAQGLRPPSAISWHVLANLAPAYFANTAALLAGVALACAAIGVGAAWLVVMCRFPGRRLLEAALVLPMAAPAWVLAYVYYDLLSVAGPVQATLRELTGWGARDYWFPAIGSLGGAVFVMSASLYPYVYLLARAAFLQQSGATMDVARTLGCSPTQSFFRVMLPLARPALIVGVALVAMETLAEYGAFVILGVPTFTTGIYRAWFSMGDRLAAAQLACALLAFAALALTLERHGRRRARHANVDADHRPRGAGFALGPAAALSAFLLCALPPLAGFVLPALALARLALAPSAGTGEAGFLEAALNSVALGASTAAAAAAVALVIAFAVRFRPSPVGRAAARIAGLGYAAPGPVVALGVLITLAALDRAIAGVAQALSFGPTGLVAQASAAALVFAYLTRFMAAPLGAVESGFSKITPHVEDAARNLGVGAARRLWTVHGPLLAPSIVVAAMVTFVDVVKELPATLILRPFDFETLAVRAFDLVRDERLTEAAAPALAVMATGLIPAAFLALRLRR